MHDHVEGKLSGNLYIVNFAHAHRMGTKAFSKLSIIAAGKLKPLACTGDVLARKIDEPVSKGFFNVVNFCLASV